MIAVLAPTILPMIVIPLTFLFVLLVILIARAPKVGVWVVGGLILLAPILYFRLAVGGALAPRVGVPLFVIPATFLFVLLVILLARAPKVGIGLVIALVLMAVVGFFIAIPVSHRRVSYEPAPQAQEVRQRVSSDGESDAIVEFDRVYEDFVQTPSAPSRPAPPAPPGASSSPIWSQGVEQEFEADVYPSERAAARALGWRMAEPIRSVAGDPNATLDVVLFLEGTDRNLVTVLGRAMEQDLPGVTYAIEADLRNIEPDEVGVTLRISEEVRVQQSSRTKGMKDLPVEISSRRGKVVATVFTQAGRSSVEADFVAKSWLENFGAFASERPGQTFLVARSAGTSTSESEAHQQALDDARAQLAKALGKHVKRRFAGLPEPEITPADVLQGDFIVDRFTQSFDTLAGRVWRHAMLIHLSGPKLAQLAERKGREADSMRMSWARMGLSVIGVLVLIGLIYFFLNAATMGYYEWSLRIAGVVLAIIAIVSVLMIV